jgi:3-phenylpropionate/trans-cinnamate dioxygenase ferredoxin subunit
VTFVHVAELAELTEGVPHVVELEERRVGIILWRSEVFAVRDICPHQFAPVCSGYTMPMIVSDECGVIKVDEDRLVLLCPWHQWEFDVRTGDVVVGEENYRLRTYPARVEDGRVLINLERGRAVQ